MSLLSGVSDFFGLDIGTTAIRVAQFTADPKSKQLILYYHEAIDSKLALSDSETDKQRLIQKVKQVITNSGLNTNNVAVGIPSQKVFTTVFDIEKLSPEELAKTIRLQADSIIPTPLAESKIDWSVIGDSPSAQNKAEVLISSVPNKYIEQRLDLLESIGLNVIAFEPDNLALARSLISPNTTAPCMVLDIDSRSTDLVIVSGGAPRLTRSIPTGADSIIKSAMQNLNIDAKQANDFVFKFGLSQQKLEGQIYHAIIGTVDVLMNDIDKSIKFFQTRYGGAKIEKVIMTGGASTLPEFPLYIANKFGINVEIGNSWLNVTYPKERQNELMSVSNHFGVASGLAQRNV